jgi:hypothetical protein
MSWVFGSEEVERASIVVVDDGFELLIGTGRYFYGRYLKVKIEILMMFLFLFNDDLEEVDQRGVRFQPYLARSLQPASTSE